MDHWVCWLGFQGGTGMDSEDMFVEAEKGEIADDAAHGEGELGCTLGGAVNWSGARHSIALNRVAL